MVLISVPAVFDPGAITARPSHVHAAHAARTRTSARIRVCVCVCVCAKESVVEASCLYPAHVYHTCCRLALHTDSVLVMLLSSVASCTEFGASFLSTRFTAHCGSRHGSLTVVAARHHYLAPCVRYCACNTSLRPRSRRGGGVNWEGGGG